MHGAVYLIDYMRRIMLVAAHPDDETIGASTLLSAALAVVHVTDGSPRNLSDAMRFGFSDAAAYATARRKELREAWTVAGVSPQHVSLGIADQEASYHIPGIAARLRELIEVFRPDAITTHPYEGGHPDHDACALAARIACANDCDLREFTSYHNWNGLIRTGEFLDNGGAIDTIELDAEQRERKRLMLACFRTQADTLQYFGVERERFRPAPAYDFTQPPHPGILFYEQFSWGMTGERFRKLAAEAMALC